MNNQIISTLTEIGRQYNNINTETDAELREKVSDVSLELLNMDLTKFNGVTKLPDKLNLVRGIILTAIAMLASTEKVDSREDAEIIEKLNSTYGSTLETFVLEMTNPRGDTLLAIVASIGMEIQKEIMKNEAENN